MINLASCLDLANHRADASKKDVEKLCQDVLKYGFHSAFVNPCWIRLTKTTINEHFRNYPQTQRYLEGGIIRKPKVGTVISFPLGQDTTEMKIYAIRQAIKKGADELDVSTNVGLLKSGKEKIYLKELKRIVKAAKKIRAGTVVKFIIETGLLSEQEIKKASLLVLKSGADFIKTCSGLGPRGSRIDDISLIKEAVFDKIPIKVAGGIQTKNQAEKFIQAGASRIGTSKAVSIVTEK
ncbi:MAG TPA: deoxyribose-phosphate aldolase [Candidatus Bathyarchaeia archaeon]|nr:deoxyribose-phosphate aldolase [Candidatus Bathyarchaeia archaeon]